jgi:hypothetical protein
LIPACCKLLPLFYIFYVWTHFLRQYIIAYDLITQYS